VPHQALDARAFRAVADDAQLDVAAALTETTHGVERHSHTLLLDQSGHHQDAARLQRPSLLWRHEREAVGVHAEMNDSIWDAGQPISIRF
jgi:hypothetical protein